MLRVTKLTDYATVVLTVLAARPADVLSAADLAETAGLETPTVSKLLKPLAQAGLVMEGPLAMTECSQHDSHCGIAHQCGVRANWRLINDVVADALRGVTLAQMLKPPSSSDDVRRRPIALHVASS